MASIKIDRLNAGMVVASDVKDRSGRVLMRSGVEITDKHIKILKTWGIRILEIVAEGNIVDDKPIINIDPEKLAEATKLVDSLFRHTDREHPAIREFHALCAQRFARQGLGDANHGA